MDFIAYHRVSTHKQGIDGNGIAAQKVAVERYLKAVDGILLASFQEVESGANNERPELAAALKMAKSRKAKLVIAKLDRLSRNASFLLRLQDSGVDFVACDLPSADRFTVGILALVAQRERELISERTKAGLAIAKSRGVILGNPNSVEAWKKAQETIQKRKNAFVDASIRSIQEIQSTGIHTLSRIADCLNKRGETTALRCKWTPSAVRRVLMLHKSQSD